MPDTLNDEIASQIEKEMYNPRSIDSLLRRVEMIEARLNVIDILIKAIQDRENPAVEQEDPKVES